MLLTIRVRVDILLCDSHHRIQIIQLVLSSPAAALLFSERTGADGRISEDKNLRAASSISSLPET